MKIALTALVRGYEDITHYDKLIARNRCILKNFVPKLSAPCDLILFHEGNIPEHHQYIINQKSGQDFHFVDLRTTPPFTAFNKYKEEENIVAEMNGIPQGYRHMCKFWFMDFLGYLSGYDYIGRVDEDVLVLETEDVFSRMSGDGLIYKSPGISKDQPFACIGIVEFCKFIAERTRRTDITVPDIAYGPMTNVMYVNIQEILKSKEFKEFSEMVDRSGMIYTNRWGDHILWYFFLSMFAKPSQYEFNDAGISYYHGSHNALIGNGEIRTVSGEVAYGVW
jgi:hypothetical protein